MENNLVGYRFSPTKVELLNYYLKNKNLDKPWLVDDAISEIDICAHDPKSLPSLSKLKSNDPEWYFFSLREYHAPEKKKKGTKRTTPTGFWKITGKLQEIRDKRGHGIGIKKTLVYLQGRSANGVKTPWVMHEYHITSLPPNQSNYVICKVMYKGVDGDSLFGNNSNELSHSTMVSVSNTARVINTTPEVEQPGGENLFRSMYNSPTPMNEQDDTTQFNSDTLLNDIYPHQLPQAPWDDDDDISELLRYNGGNYDDVCSDLETIFQEYRNDHRPKKPLTWIPTDCSSESDDAESISATSYQGISSPDSVHNLSRHFHKEVLSSSNVENEIPSLGKDFCKDTQPHAETSINRKTRKSHLTRRTIPSKQEVKEGTSKSVDASMDKKSSSSSSPMVKTEKKGWFITDEAMQRDRKAPQYIYLMNLIIGFILLVAVIAISYLFH